MKGNNKFEESPHLIAYFSLSLQKLLHSRGKKRIGNCCQYLKYLFSLFLSLSVCCVFSLVFPFSVTVFMIFCGRRKREPSLVHRGNVSLVFLYGITIQLLEDGVYACAAYLCVYFSCYLLRNENSLLQSFHLLSHLNVNCYRHFVLCKRIYILS